MRTIILLFCILFFSHISALTLKEKIEHAPQGTYVAFDQNSTISILIIKEKIPAYIILEELTVPKKYLPRKEPLKTWIQKGAPGHTSWVSYMVNTTSGTIEEMYSYTQEKWYSPQNANAFFGTLLSLQFIETPLVKQRKIGPPPQRDEEDRRKVWKPALIREGKSVKQRLFDVYHAQWPKDETDLSEKEIEVYLDKEKTDFPFPYWIQVKDTAITYKLRAIDSGHGVLSPHSQTPMRPIKSISPIKNEKDILRITLYAQEYHLPLKIILLDTQSGETHTIDTAEITKPTPGVLSISLSKTRLKQLVNNKQGRFQLLFSSEGKHSSLSYTTSSFKL